MSHGSAQTTVVIPVWGRYVADLPEALASLRAQGVAMHILLVDNASEVPLPELPDVKVIRSERRLTLGAARNLALQQVQTPNVVVWDADDVMLPGTLARLERALERRPALAAFSTAIVESSGARHRWPRRWAARLARAPALFTLLHCVWSLYPSTGATIMRTELLCAGGGYTDADSGDDWAAGVSLAFRGRLGWSEQPGRIYRDHADSIWAKHSTPSSLLAHARDVRRRIRTDPGIPVWVRRVLPLIQLGQYTAIAAHVALEAGRRLRAD